MMDSFLKLRSVCVSARRLTSEKYYKKPENAEYPDESYMQKVTRRMSDTWNPDQLKGLQPKYQQEYGCRNLIADSRGFPATRKVLYMRADDDQQQPQQQQQPPQQKADVPPSAATPETRNDSGK